MTKSTDDFQLRLPDWAGTDFHTQVVGNPALAIVGAHDPELSADVIRATWMTWFPSAALLVLPDTGHYALDEAPLALVSAVEHFLQDHSHQRHVR